MLRLEHVAGNLARHLAVQARGDGATWAEVAEAAGIQPDGERWQRAEAAFEWAAGPSSGWSWSASVGWSCGTCAQSVVDRGPYGSHPDDDESGHTADCTRHQAALTTWAADRDDGDEDQP